MNNSTESSLLSAARNGDIETVKSLVTALKENRLSFDLNCTGVYISGFFLSQEQHYRG